MRLWWNIALIAAGLLYLGLVLFGSVESPLFALVFVTLAGFEVIHTRRMQR